MHVYRFSRNALNFDLLKNFSLSFRRNFPCSIDFYFFKKEKFHNTHKNHAEMGKMDKRTEKNNNFFFCSYYKQKSKEFLYSNFVCCFLLLFSLNKRSFVITIIVLVTFLLVFDLYISHFTRRKKKYPKPKLKCRYTAFMHDIEKNREINETEKKFTEKRERESCGLESFQRIIFSTTVLLAVDPLCGFFF